MSLGLLWRRLLPCKATKVRFYITGQNGFLAHKLMQSNRYEWSDDIASSDALFLLGSPTCGHGKLPEDFGTNMHSYVEQTIDIIRNHSKPVVFASTTGINDISTDHSGHTTYNLAKLYLENYIIHNVEQYLILRIGTIISRSCIDVDMMKPDRIQQRIRNREYTGIEQKDSYLDVNTFVSQTLDTISTIDNQIIEYPHVTLSLFDLLRYER